MFSDFVAFLAPPGKEIRDYDRTLPPSEQPATIHHTFRDAMYVREEVFVKEQDVPLDRELDDEDPHSFHWVVYASVGAPKGTEAGPAVQRGFGPSDESAAASPSDGQTRPDDGVRSRSASTATNLPVGVIRLVPPPDAVRRKSHDSSSPSSPVQDTSTHEPDTYPHPTVFPGERYIRLGRLATLKDYRGLGLSRLLVNAALQYARKNPDEFGQARIEGVALEEARLQGRHVNDTWKGLVYVHAQKDRTIDLWKRYGFEIDEGMGTWDEEGMDHVGMYKRLDVETQ